MQRLKQRADFLATATGAKVPATAFVLQVLRRRDGGPVRVGFTVSKKIGTAVERNRVRRRLRAAVGAAEARGLLGSGAYLVGAGREVLTMPVAELETAVLAALADAREAGA